MLSRLWLLGGVLGLAFAVMVSFLSDTGIGDSVGIATQLNYVTSLPTYLTMELMPSASESFVGTVLFFYCAMVGSMIGFALGQGFFWRIAMIATMAALVYAHKNPEAAFGLPIELVTKLFAAIFKKLKIMFLSF